MAARDYSEWAKYMPEFREKTEAFFTGELPMKDYKGFSGFYGSYAQKGGQASMLRLRMPAGRVTKEKMAFVAEKLKAEDVKRMHFTTCQTIQLHDLERDRVYRIMEEALSVGILPMGGGGDFPRNVMCSPLSGVEQGEYFDVQPFAQAAGEFLVDYITKEKMPRKLKVCFSNSPKNIPHATYRDLGFVAREDGYFDVYCAGGLGNNHRLGIQVGSAVDSSDIFTYIHAMWLMFRTYGNYENRAKARTRYMQEKFETPEAFVAAFGEKLGEAKALGLSCDLPKPVLTGSDCAADPVCDKKTGLTRRIPQKQKDLFAVAWHPIGGFPKPQTFCKVSDFMQGVENGEMRLAPDETAYLINLSAAQADELIDLIKDDSALSLFETSVSCVGAMTCQVGVRNSQELLRACVTAVREADLPDGVLPQIHISGCPSSCGTHQTGELGFRGGMKRVDGKPASAFVLYVNGCEKQGKEVFADEVGALTDEEIPQFLVALGKSIAETGMSYADWHEKNPNGVAKLAKSLGFVEA